MMAILTYYNVGSSKQKFGRLQLNHKFKLFFWGAMSINELVKLQFVVKCENPLGAHAAGAGVEVEDFTLAFNYHYCESR